MWCVGWGGGGWAVGEAIMSLTRLVLAQNGLENEGGVS